MVHQLFIKKELQNLGSITYHQELISVDPSQQHLVRMLVHGCNMLEGARQRLYWLMSHDQHLYIS